MGTAKMRKNKQGVKNSQFSEKGLSSGITASLPGSVPAQFCKAPYFAMKTAPSWPL